MSSDQGSQQRPAPREVRGHRRRGGQRPEPEGSSTQDGSLASPASETPETAPSAGVENRWWVEQQHSKVNEKERRALAQAAFREGSVLPNLPGAKFFEIGMGFDQERARANLTDSNLNLLREGNPPENGWGYLQTTPEKTSEEFLARVKKAFRLPAGSRGLLVDSGTSLRVILSGTPVGERLVEVLLGKDSSFDAWREGNWVKEAYARGREKALRDFPRMARLFLIEEL